MKYAVIITGAMTVCIDVEADNPLEARGKAQAIWENGEVPIEMDEGNFEPDDWSEATVMELAEPAKP